MKSEPSNSPYDQYLPMSRPILTHEQLMDSSWLSLSSSRTEITRSLRPSPSHCAKTKPNVRCGVAMIVVNIYSLAGPLGNEIRSWANCEASALGCLCDSKRTKSHHVCNKTNMPIRFRCVWYGKAQDFSVNRVRWSMAIKFHRIRGHSVLGNEPFCHQSWSRLRDENHNLLST